MSLQELKKNIDLAIDDCQHVIEKNPKAVLSEGDLERLLSFCISRRIGYVPENPAPDAFAVYSQISHYDNEEEVLDARVDLLLMKPNDVKECCDHYKRFIYRAAESFAIELKYLHADNAGAVNKAKEDIDKYVRYKDDSHYYAVILLDENDKTDEYEQDILSYHKKKIEELDGNDKSFCRVLRKKVTLEPNTQNENNA